MLSKRILLIVILLCAFIFASYPPLINTSPKAWQLFLIFFSTILAILFNLMPITAASVLALSIAVLSGLIDPKIAYSGFSESFILLIVAAFLVSHAVHKSGLGKRIALHMIRKFGKSTLGISYSLIATDILISPAFPSNTARSGILYPIVYDLAHNCDSKIADGTRHNAGSFLMLSSMAGLTISSGFWLTAMAVNPLGVSIADSMGISITFASWLAMSFLPSLFAFIFIPLILYKFFPPLLKKTPQAPIKAKEALEKMGDIKKNEWITASVFLGMLILWSLSSLFPYIDKTAVAFGGLGVLMLTKVFTVEDFRSQGEALNTLIWFAILFVLSTELARLGFMDSLTHYFLNYLNGFHWISVYLILIIFYVFIHYFFVSQSAHLIALYGLFLSIGVKSGVPGELMAMMLLLASNFNALIAPQGSSANAIYLSSEYVTPKEIYQYGGLTTLINTLIYLLIGTPWILLISSIQ